MTMTPKQTAQFLLRIASAIENSKNPRRDLVAKDLKQVLVSIKCTTNNHSVRWGARDSDSDPVFSDSKKLVWKVELDEPTVISEGFDGDRTRFLKAQKEIKELFERYNIQQMSNLPEGWLRGDFQAYAKLIEAAGHDSRSMKWPMDGPEEWPEDDPSVLLTFMAEQTPVFANGQITESDGTKYWYTDGELGREDGPAIQTLDGSKHWYLNNKRHREDGPAIERSDGTKEWYLNNRKQPPKLSMLNRKPSERY